MADAVVTSTVVLWPIRMPSGRLVSLTTTPYVTTLLLVVAVGSIEATLPVAVAPVSAFQVIVGRHADLQLRRVGLGEVGVRLHLA